MLVEYLDAVYNDAEGWAELASVYASMGLCVPLRRLCESQLNSDP